MKKVFYIIGLFIIGLLIAFYLESFFRELIQDLFQITTNNKIYFRGKDLHLFSDSIYSICFGISFSVLIFHNYKNNIKTMIFNVLVWMLLFLMALTILCAIDANSKLIECTQCDDGIRALNYNEINYGLILGISSILAIVPVLIKRIFIKNKYERKT